CLGASRWRVIQQLLTESLLLAALGGGAGLLLGWWSLEGFMAAALLNPLRGEMDVSLSLLAGFLTLDARVLGYTFLLALLAGVAFGLVPALRATRADLTTTLKDEGVGSHRGLLLGRSRLRNGLVAPQVALSLVLLIVAGLLLRGLDQPRLSDPGFANNKVLVVDLDLRFGPQTQFRAEQIRRELTERLAALPGVQAVSRARRLSTDEEPARTSIILEGENAAAGQEARQVCFNEVTPNYFDTLNIPLERGRVFSEAEVQTGATVVVSEATARKLWPGADPLGKSLRTQEGWPFAQAQVIGVVRDPQPALSEMDPLFIYVPLASHKDDGSHLLLRTSNDARHLRPLALAAARTFGSVLLEARTLAELADKRLGPARAASVLS
ncbi:MAG: ABC transporter permease, partial [Acidobacteria bacterium]|nr:ABC transporter permease [Acidobacteriota bacterium]